MARWCRRWRPLGLVAMLALVSSLVASPWRAGAAETAAPEADPYAPRFAADFPDPSLLRVGDLTYAFATNGPHGNVQVIRSGDLQAWERLPDALPQLPSWARPHQTWAPSVLARGPASYVLYYSARHAGTDRHCIGRAVGARPEGPFRDEMTQPFLCQLDLGGSIDPQPFVDAGGAAWLLFKSEGRPGAEPTRIFTQRLSDDGLSRVGPPTELLHTDRAWEEPIIEGPAMIHAAGAYWLFYAANRWESPSYAIGSARCASPSGPCTKDPTNPLLASRGSMSGPGSPDFLSNPDGTMLLAFHAWTKGAEGYPGGARALRTVPLTFVGGKPAVPGTVRRSGGGYRLVAADGGIFSYGSATFAGSTGDRVLNQPIVAMATTATGAGYWLVASDGGIFSFGDADFLGSTGHLVLNEAVVDMAPTPTGRGYWLVARDGGIFTFGDAAYHGSTGDRRLNRPIVGMAPTATGRGYWLVASDGGIFAFGDARFHGSTGDMVLNSPIVSLVPTPWDDGYWLVAADGGVFAFGRAPFLGSTGGTPLNSPIVAAAATPAGDGYWFTARDGGVFSFGAAAFHGSAGGTPLNHPVVGMAA